MRNNSFVQEYNKHLRPNDTALGNQIMHKWPETAVNRPFMDVMRMETESSLLFWVKGVCILLISIIGICLNITTICIIFPQTRQLKSIFSVLIVALFASDTIFLAIQASISLIYHILCVSSKTSSKAYAKVLLPLWNISLAHSIFITIALTIERYISLLHPKLYFILIKRATSRRLCFLVYVAPITIFTFLFHIPSFFMNISKVLIQVTGSKNSWAPNKCYLNVEKHLNIATYHNTYARLLVEGIIPLSVLIYCNLRLYIKVRAHMKKLLSTQLRSIELKEMPSDITLLDKHDKKASFGVTIRSSGDTANYLAEKIWRLSELIKYELAKTSIAIVLVFAACQTPNLIFRFCESIFLDSSENCKAHNHPLWVIQLEAASKFMLVLNSSFNVVVYCFFDKHYRNIVKGWINKTSGKPIFRISTEPGKKDNYDQRRPIS